MIGHSITLTAHRITIDDLQRVWGQNVLPQKTKLWVCHQSVIHRDGEGVLEDISWGYLTLDYEMPGGINLQYFTNEAPIQMLEKILKDNNNKNFSRSGSDNTRLILYSELDDSVIEYVEKLDKTLKGEEE